jgi:hypothetical protein
MENYGEHDSPDEQDASDDKIEISLNHSLHRLADSLLCNIVLTFSPEPN